MVVVNYNKILVYQALNIDKEQKFYYPMKLFKAYIISHSKQISILLYFLKITG